MASKKEVIFNALQVANCPVAYSDTNHTSYPRINYSLINHYSIRLSGQRQQHKLTYQVDYFSTVPLDVETDEVLYKIIDSLESNGLCTTDWREVVDVDVQEQLGIYRYFIEVV